MEKRNRIFPLVSLLLLAFSSAQSQSFIGVNYGQVADNLPPPQATASLLESTTISKLRLYGADPAVITALANTNISIVIGTSNADIPSLASNPSAASTWLSVNVLPFLPASVISVISVGNEALSSGDASLSSQLLPAMQNLQTALSSALPSSSIKISTVHSMAILAQSDPPSSGSFHSDLTPVLQPILGFLKQTGSPFMINPYPFFAYRSDPRPETLAFCLFQPNPGRVDAVSQISYANMFDAQVDAIRSALNGAGFPDVEIVVAETGWPYRGDPDEVGASVDNAKAYNGNLVAHLKSMVGTPMMPGKSVDTYLFALYDEDLKPGPTSERSFGIFRPDLTMTYDIGLTRTSVSSQQASPTPSAVKPYTSCIPIAAGTTDKHLQANSDHACEQQPSVDCTPIQPGGSCFLPSSVGSHAPFAMNFFYYISRRSSPDCDFKRTATITSHNPTSLASLLRLHTVEFPSSAVCGESKLKAVVAWTSYVFSFNLLFYMTLPLLLT